MLYFALTFPGRMNERIGEQSMTEVLPGLAKGFEQLQADAPPSSLSPREREVVVLICEGLSAKRIAQKLGITFKTTESYKKKIAIKTRTHCVVELVRWAIRQGMVTP